MNLSASRVMLAALIGANALLVCTLVFASSARQAQAGFGGGNYSLAVGQSSGLSQETVYVMDGDSGKVWSITCNTSTRKLELYGAADLGKDLNDKAVRPR